MNHLELFEPHIPRLWSVAYRFSYGPDVDAAAADAVMAAWERFLELSEPPANVGAWLVTVTRRAAVDASRHYVRKSKGFAPLEIEPASYDQEPDYDYLPRFRDVLATVPEEFTGYVSDVMGGVCKTDLNRTHGERKRRDMELRTIFREFAGE